MFRTASLYDRSLYSRNIANTVSCGWGQLMRRRRDRRDAEVAETFSRLSFGKEIEQIENDSTRQKDI